MILGIFDGQTCSRPAKGIPVTGSLSLDDFSKRFRMLEVRCGHCTRRGRLRIDKLIDEHGRDMSLPDLRKHPRTRSRHLQKLGSENPPAETVGGFRGKFGYWRVSRPRI